MVPQARPRRARASTGNHGKKDGAPPSRTNEPILVRFTFLDEQIPGAGSQISSGVDPGDDGRKDRRARAKSQMY